jgi:hypothetical protein
MKLKEKPLQHVNNLKQINYREPPLPVAFYKTVYQP